MFLKFIFSRFIGSVFLISGTAIGAGMLGLPIRILGLNFYLNFIIFLSLWLIMFFSAIAFLEVSFWIKGSLNIVSISKYLFGTKFSYLISIFYIFFLYSLISAYIVSGSGILIDILGEKKYLFLHSIFFKLVFVVPFCFIIFFGINLIDYVNRILFLLLMLSYFFLSFHFLDLNRADINNLNFLETNIIFFSMPIMITSFGYSLIIPSLKMYLFNNTRIIGFVIFFGSFIPFLIYIIWEYLTCSFFLDIGNKVYIQIIFSSNNPTEKLIGLLSNNNIYIFYLILLFSFFALSSSFIGVSLGLYDFFFDLLNFSRGIHRCKLLVLFLVFFFPIVFSLFYPDGFVLALSYAGVFASILLILFPIYALWYGRYIKKLAYKYILLDSKFFLFFLFFIGLVIIFIDMFEKCLY